MRNQHLLSHILTTHNCDGLFITNPITISYLSGYFGFSLHERDAFLLVTQKKRYLFTSSLYSTDVKHQATDVTVLEYTASNPLLTQLTLLCQKNTLTTIGFEADNLTVAEWKKYKTMTKRLSPILLPPLRGQKSTAEISLIQKACKVADQALAAIHPSIQQGMSEKDIVSMLEYEIRNRKAEIAFPTIVAFGANAATPHHTPDETKLKKGDALLIDFGARIQGYNSDMTRTFFIGDSTAEEKSMYHAVLSAQQQAVSYIQDKLTPSHDEAGGNIDIRAHDVDEIARIALTSQGYPSIPHSLGHGIGLEVHEFPRLSPHSTDMLAEGMVFSLEPGVYVPLHIGIRIEDLYVIKKGKLKQLTKFPSKLQVVS